MRKFALTRAALLCCGVSTIAIPAVASAQADSGYSSNEIIVTATREETALQDTPMAIDVVSGDDIQKLNIFDTKEIQNLSPGLELSNTTGRNNTATMRGVAFDPDGGTSPAVEVFYNEIGANANTVFTAIYDLGQVEILRGPQGLFRGKTSPAGALLFGTKRANLSEVEGYFQGTGTTENAVNLQGAVSMPLVEDKLALRVAGLYDENDVAGVTNVDGRKSSNRTYSARVTLSMKPTDTFEAHLMYQYLDSKLQPWIVAFGPGNTLAAGVTGPELKISDRKSVIEGPLDFTNKTHFLTFNSTLDIGAADVNLNLGWQDTKLGQLRDQDLGNAIPNFERIQDLFTSFKQFSSELRIGSKAGSRFKWSLSGGFTQLKNFVPLYTDLHLFTPGGYAIPTPIPLGPLVMLENTTTTRTAVDLSINSKTYSLAGTLGYEITDAITVTGGIRYTKNDTHRTQDVVLPLDGGVVSLVNLTGDPADYFTGLDLCSNFGPGSPFFQIVDLYDPGLVKIPLNGSFC